MKSSNCVLNRKSLFIVLAVVFYCTVANTFAGGYFTIDLTQDEQFYPAGDTSTYSLTPSQNMKINFIIIECLSDKNNDALEEQFQVSITSDSAGNNPINSMYSGHAAVCDLIDNFGSTDGVDFDTHMYLFDIPDTYVSIYNSYYLALEVGGGAPVHTWGKAYIYYDDTTIEPSKIAHGRYRTHINVPNGHKFVNPGDYITTQFKIQDSRGTVCRYITMNCLDDDLEWDHTEDEVFEVAICSDSNGDNVLASARIRDNFRSHGRCDGHMYSFDIPDINLPYGTYWLKTKAVSSTPIRTWAGADLYWSNWQSYTWQAMLSPPDVDKSAHGHSGTNSCWIATAANMLAGAGYGIGSTVQARADNIYNQLTGHFDVNNPGWPRTALKWWLASSNNIWPTNPYVFVGLRGNWKSTAVVPYSNSKAPSIIGNKLRDGEYLGLSFFWGSGTSIGHVTAVWGDEGYTADNYDWPLQTNPTKVIISDSDEDNGDLQKYTYQRFYHSTYGVYGWKLKEYGSRSTDPWIRCYATLSRADLDPLTTYSRRQRIIGSYKVTKQGMVPDADSLHYVVGAQTGNLILWDTEIDWDTNTVPTIVDSPSQPKQLTVDWDFNDHPVPYGSQITITTGLGIENGGGIWYKNVGFPGIYANIPDFGLDVIHNMLGSTPFEPNDEDIIGGFIYGSMSITDGDGNDCEFRFVKEYDFDQDPEWHNVIISPHPEATEVYHISNLKFGHAYTLPDEPNDIWQFDEWLTDSYTGPYDLVPMGPPLEFELNWAGMGLLPYPTSNNYQGDSPPPERTFEADQDLQGLWHSDSAWGDFDNDGDLDLVICGKYPYLSPWTWVTLTYENRGGTLVQKTQADLTGISNESGGGLAWGDYDGDGDLDLAMAGITEASTRIARIYENDGAGILTYDSNQVLVGVSNAAVAWGDYDNDGDLDLVVTGYDGNEPSSILYKNDPLGTLTAEAAISLTGLHTGSADFADIDGDADMDLVLTGYDGTNRRIIFYENDPVGTLVDEGNKGLPGVNLSDVAFGDYDNDADLDIAITGSDGEGSKTSRIYENDGTGAFINTSAALQSVYRSSVAWGDYDNDGDLDLALCGYDGGSLYTKLYRNTGSGFSAEGYYFPAVREGSLSFADVNDDGNLDFFITGADWSNTYARLYTNEGGFANIGPSEPNSLTCTPDDVNGGIVLEWSGAEDNETPYEGLYYVVRVGTEPSGNDILSGTYSTPLTGNRGQKNRLFLEVPKNTYYWSVKTVDSGLRTGTWAIEQVCRHCRGSVDCDCDVEFRDLALMAKAWLTYAGDDDYNEDCDISDLDDDFININDLDVLAENWLLNK